jgi:hypothetical protein
MVKRDQSVVQEGVDRDAQEYGAVERETITVNIVKQQGQSTLVQWQEADQSWRRAYVPSAEVENSMVAREVLSLGIPYGVDWASMLEDVVLTPAQMDSALKRFGIWEWKDLDSRPHSYEYALEMLVHLRDRLFEKKA